MNLNSYYKDQIRKYGGIDKYILAKAKEKKALLDRVRKYAKSKRVLEAGCGSAVNSIFLANEGYSVFCIDNDYKMIKLAKTIAKDFKKSPYFKKENILKFNNKKFDVVFSHGVLEHFKDKEIVSIINKELSLGDYVIISIPSDFFKPNQAIEGNERFLSVKEWLKIISQTNGEVIETFSYFYDPDKLSVWLYKVLFKINF
jgi:2-polyprenyl-3-methyl-5-hydroxy-6-metoxy-1,4-benzoquinol methylase